MKLFNKNEAGCPILKEWACSVKCSKKLKSSLDSKKKMIDKFVKKQDEKKRLIDASKDVDLDLDFEFGF